MMKKMELKDANPYEAPKHFAMTALRLHGKETGAEHFSMGLSHFLPGGGADFDASPLEKVYFLLEGEMTIITDTERITLKPMESVYIGPNENRKISNETNQPASMLVVMNY
jgi:quercetin dioxygenase-like cupin family protein